ncbi:MAG: hypothetical protein ACK5P5_12900 [Pseudobdellovibrionaceae bacterium]
MKTSHLIKKLMLVILGCAVLATGCAKKSDDGKNASASRNSLGRGSTGAVARDAQSSISALDYAAQQGVNDLYVESIYQPQLVNQNYSQAIGVESAIYFNGQPYPLVTYHEVYSNGSISQTNSVVAGPFTILAQGVCGDSDCQSYYLILTVLKSGSNIVQLVQRQNFNGAAQNTQSYRKPQEFIQNLQMLFAVLGQPLSAF